LSDGRNALIAACRDACAGREMGAKMNALRRNLSSLAGAILGTAALLAPRAGLAAGGAYVVDDVEVAAPGACKVESWASFATNSDLAAVTSPACVVDLGRPVEIGGQFQRSRSDDAWGSSAAAKAKMNLIPLEGQPFGLAISGAATFDLITGQASSYSVNVPVTFVVNDQFRININGGYLYDRANRIDYATWGAGFEWNFVKPLTLIGEIFGQAGKLPLADVDAAPSPNAFREPRFQAGLRVTPQDNLDIDLIYGRNITGENANWMTVGLNVRF
jgi:hypothetical protein